MTREEAIRELKADYCGNRIICELYPDQCNREDCEIWLAIKALETQHDGDCISRQAAIDAVNQYNFDFPQYMERFVTELRDAMKADLKHDIEALPSAQPKVAKDICVPNNDCISRHVAIDALDSIGSLDTDADREYARDIFKTLPSAQPEETCDTCKYGYFGDGICDKCRVRYQSHYERITDGN